jgi:hypothetical protein
MIWRHCPDFSDMAPFATLEAMQRRFEPDGDKAEL